MAPGYHPQGIIIPVFHTSLSMAKTYSNLIAVMECILSTAFVSIHTDCKNMQCKNIYKNGTIDR